MTTAAKNKAKKIIFFTIIALVLLYLIFLIVYQTILRHRPDQIAETVLQEYSTSISKDQHQNLVFNPSQPTTDGIIFYGGAFSDPAAYAPFLQSLANQGYFVVTPAFPFNLANLGSNKARTIIKDYPEITNWTGIGHSLGGTALAAYTSKNPNQLQKLIFLASYPNNSLKSYSGGIATILGTEDLVLNESARQKAEATYLPGKAALITIPGANHHQFGNYRLNNTIADGTPTMSSSDQQAQVVVIIKSLLQSSPANIQPTVTVIDSVPN